MYAYIYSVWSVIGISQTYHLAAAEKCKQRHPVKEGHKLLTIVNETAINSGKYQ